MNPVREVSDANSYNWNIDLCFHMPASYLTFSPFQQNAKAREATPDLLPVLWASG
jgi:hypothetical protein